MNVLTYNICGSGSSIKRIRLRKNILAGKADICFIQETKNQSMMDEVVNSLWGNKACGWSTLDAIGQSGGILIVWRDKVICLTYNFKWTRFLGINAMWNGLNCYFVNVYSPCGVAEKCKLWSDLIEWKNKIPKGEWLTGGDFNAIKTLEERRGHGRVGGVLTFIKTTN
ncbi:unnamed protein product [Lathyrus sativus]|nr:unnamed protein product [Lathyrus sativus]